MRFSLVIITSLLGFFSSVALAQSPPFSKVTITGEIDTKFNKVCLFKSGSSKRPIKTGHISSYSGEYSIDVEIPDDMQKKDNYLYADMRFWGDKNNNGIREPGEPISECHFIIWVPSAQIVYMKIYKGPSYQFKSSTLDYDYKK